MNIVCSGLAILLGLGILLSAAVGDDLGFGLAEEHLAPDSGKQYGAAAGDVLGDAGSTPADTLTEDTGSKHGSSADSRPVHVPAVGLRGGGVVAANNPHAASFASLPNSIKSHDDISRLRKGLDDARDVIAQSFADFKSQDDVHGSELFSSLLPSEPEMRAMLSKMNDAIPIISEALSSLHDSTLRERRLVDDGEMHDRASRHEYPNINERPPVRAQTEAKHRSPHARQMFGASEQELRQFIPHSLKSLSHILGIELMEDIDGQGHGRGRRRLASDDVDSFCAAPCTTSSCSCERLRTCALALTMSEYAVLFSQGLENRDGELDIDADLFDASRLYQKVKGDEGILALARSIDVNNQGKCEELLQQFHLPCRDGMVGCTGANDQSYQLSIDEICDAIGSSEDLKFSEISKAFDQKLDDDDVCGELFSQDYYLQMRSALANDIKAKLKKRDSWWDPMADDMENILADGRLDRCLLDSRKCVIELKRRSGGMDLVGFTGTCNVRRCYGIQSLIQDCCDDCCHSMPPLPGIDGKTIPFADWVKERIDATVQNHVANWSSCAENTQCDPDSMMSHAACDEFLTCSGEIWRAGNRISYTPNKYPFGPNVYNGFNTWADVWWPEAWNLDRDPKHGIAFPSLLKNVANTGGDDDGTFAYARDGNHDVTLSFVYKDSKGEDLKISDGFDKVTFFEKEYTFRIPTACAASKIPGTDNTKCDDSKTLLFGKDSSVGQICSIAKAMEEEADPMPGKCCLDNAITSNKFGKKFVCEEGWNSCQNPGPFMSGFSPGACDQVGGTFCRAPCDKLMACVDDLRGTRNFCRASAFSLIQAGNYTPKSSPADCDVHLGLACMSDGLPCDEIVLNQTSTAPVATNFSLPSSNRAGFDNTSSFVYATSTTPSLQNSEHRVALECIPTTLDYTFRVANTGEHCMEILKFSKLRDGIQTDLTHILLEAGLDLIVCPSHGDVVFSFSETVRLCAGRALKSAFVIESENEGYDSAFSEFTAGLVISDSEDEEQCQSTREALRFDPAHTNDQELCDLLADMKCGLNPYRLSGEYEELADIPEFEDFDFEGFAPNNELSFQHVQRTEMEKKVKLPHEKSLIRRLALAVKIAEGGAKFWFDYAVQVQSYECPIFVASGYGESYACTSTKAGTLFKIWLLTSAGGVLALVAKVAYSRVAAGDIEAHEAATYAKEIHRNVLKLNGAITDNLNIINLNMRNQHGEVRATLAEQHSIVATLLTEQHNSVGEQLTTQHVVLNDNLGSLQNNLQLKHGEIMELIEWKAGEVQTNLEQYIRDEIQATIDSTQLTVEEIQSTSDKMADNLESVMGLQVDAECVQPPRIKSGSGSNKAIVMAFMVYTKSHGIPTDGTIDFVDVVFHNKNGEVKSQVASLLATTPLPEGSGRQHISISIDTDKNAIRNMNDILIIDIFVKSSSGMLTRSQASVLPCFPS